MRATKQSVSSAERISYGDMASELMDVSSLLRDLGMVLVYNEIPVNASDIGVNEDKVAEHVPDFEKEFDDVYKVRANGSKDWDRILSSLEVEQLSKGNVKVYLPEKVGLPFVVVKLDYEVYTYPPQDVGSVLFFQLNPHVERELLPLLERCTLPAETATKLFDYTKAKQALATLNVNEIDLDTSEIISSYDVTDVYGTITISKGQVFNYIESSYYDNENEVFHVALKYGEGELIYSLTFGDVQRALAVILEKLVPERDLRMLEDVLKKVKKEAIRTHLLLRVMKRVEEI